MRSCATGICPALALIMVYSSALLDHGVFSQEGLGQFEGQTDVGSVKHPGTTTYDAEEQAYTVSGSGTNMWSDRDEFHFVWRRMRGDFILQARMQFMGTGVEPHRKMGWIVRTTLDSNATYINAAIHGDSLVALQFRRSVGGPTEEIRSARKGADLVQLARKGNTYTMAIAASGSTFETTVMADFMLGDEVYVGLFVCSHNSDVIEKAIFREVRLVIPAPDDFVPYRDYLGSNLEILDLHSKNRKIIYRSPDPLQAPNWTPEGKALIYNSKGRLYRFDLATQTPEVVNTDFALSNNNDHVLSFDGKQLGISHHSREEGDKSIVYTLPAQGGTPRRVTANGPSYLHGWSPEGKYLVYTGERSGEFDIYKIRASGGKEKRLTSAAGLDDGPEFTPDGKYLYFNSVRSGTMQIWRMQPDGSKPEQITHDEFNNWFPHISPDGKWIIFLSFSAEVKPDDHPFYKQVYLRLMPVAGGPAQIVAYVYGGQGTINVPSWSPDSRQVAFVSNTAMP